MIGLPFNSLLELYNAQLEWLHSALEGSCAKPLPVEKKQFYTILQSSYSAFLIIKVFGAENLKSIDKCKYIQRLQKKKKNKTHESGHPKKAMIVFFSLISRF